MVSENASEGEMERGKWDDVCVPGNRPLQLPVKSKVGQGDVGWGFHGVFYTVLSSASPPWQSYFHYISYLHLKFLIYSATHLLIVYSSHPQLEYQLHKSRDLSVVFTILYPGLRTVPGTN